MKKSLIALAVMAAAGAASAQSSVTLFGIIDATVTWGQGNIADKVQLSNNGYNSSRIGFRGTEDLGGGLSASFWIEAGFDADDGEGYATNNNNTLSGTGSAGNGRQGLTFNRRTTVSLAGNWGELRLGRDYVPQFWNTTTFDPFGGNGVGATVVNILTAISGTNDQAATRASNSIGYLLPANLGGFYGQVMYYMGEFGDPLPGQPDQKDDGSGWGVRGGFASGPFNVAAAYGRTNLGPGDVISWNVGGQWDFGVARVMGNYISNEFDANLGGTSFDGKGWTIGGLIPVGPGEIRLAYSEYKLDLGADPKVSKWALGYVHNLSKRTAVYASYAHLSNDNGAALSLGGSTTAVNGSSSGFDVGLRHSF